MLFKVMDSFFMSPLEQEEQHFACNAAMQEVMDGLVACIHQVQVTVQLLVHINSTGHRHCSKI